MLPVIGHAIFSFIDFNIIQPVGLFLVLTDHFKLTVIISIMVIYAQQSNPGISARRIRQYLSDKSLICY